MNKKIDQLKKLAEKEMRFITESLENIQSELAMIQQRLSRLELLQEISEES